MGRPSAPPRSARPPSAPLSGDPRVRPDLLHRLRSRARDGNIRARAPPLRHPLRGVGSRGRAPSPARIVGACSRGLAAPVLAHDRVAHVQDRRAPAWPRRRSGGRLPAGHASGRHRARNGHPPGARARRRDDRSRLCLPSCGTHGSRGMARSGRSPRLVRVVREDARRPAPAGDVRRPAHPRRKLDPPGPSRGRILRSPRDRARDLSGDDGRPPLPTRGGFRRTARGEPDGRDGRARRDFKVLRRLPESPASPPRSVRRHGPLRGAGSALRPLADPGLPSADRLGAGHRPRPELRRDGRRSPHAAPDGSTISAPGARASVRPRGVSRRRAVEPGRARRRLVAAVRDRKRRSPRAHGRAVDLLRACLGGSELHRAHGWRDGPRRGGDRVRRPAPRRVRRRSVSPVAPDGARLSLDSGAASDSERGGRV